MKKRKKMQVLVDNIIKLGKTLSLPPRRRIIEILVDEGSKNITDLQNILEIRSYKNARNHVNELIKVGLVEIIKAPYKEGVKVETSKERVSSVLNETSWIDLRNMFYFPISHEELENFVKNKKEVTEEEIKKKFPKIKKNMLKWYLLFFGMDYNLKISMKNKK